MLNKSYKSKAKNFQDFRSIVIVFIREILLQYSI